MINAMQEHRGSAKRPGGKEIGQIMPGGQPLSPIKKNIADKKKWTSVISFVTTLSQCLP